MNAENVLPNSLSDGFAVAKRHAIMAHDWGFPNLTKKTNSNDGPGSYQLFRFWLFLLPYAWENVTYKNTTEKRLKKSNLQNCKKMRLKKCEFQKCKKNAKKMRLKKCDFQKCEKMRLKKCDFQKCKNNAFEKMRLPKMRQKCVLALKMQKKCEKNAKKMQKKCV